MTGRMPSAQVDHIDGDQGNNRWANLREATSASNALNRHRVMQSSVSGSFCVEFRPGQPSPYRVRIKHDGKQAPNNRLL